MTEPHGPLHGVKVVACSTAQAGTVTYMLMADLGAEVIKMEVPGIGDNSRGSTVMPGFPSTYFETNNRGVKSLTLNLKTADGRDILRKLVAKADIFGQNFRPGAAEILRLRRFRRAVTTYSRRFFIARRFPCAAETIRAYYSSSNRGRTSWLPEGIR